MCNKLDPFIKSYKVNPESHVDERIQPITGCTGKYFRYYGPKVIVLNNDQRNTMTITFQFSNIDESDCEKMRPHHYIPPKNHIQQLLLRNNYDNSWKIRKKFKELGQFNDGVFINLEDLKAYIAKQISIKSEKLSFESIIDETYQRNNCFAYFNEENIPKELSTSSVKFSKTFKNNVENKNLYYFIGMREKKREFSFLGLFSMGSTSFPYYTKFDTNMIRLKVNRDNGKSEFYKIKLSTQTIKN